MTTVHMPTPQTPIVPVDVVFSCDPSALTSSYSAPSPTVDACSLQACFCDPDVCLCISLSDSDFYP